MTVAQQHKLATHIFRILKVTDISFPIGRTNKGDLSLKFTKDKEGFELILDAVPLNEKEYDNRELKSIITKYLFDTGETQFFPDTRTPGFEDLKEIVDDSTLHVTVGGVVDTADNDITDKVLGKKRGRPFGSKNKSKEVE